MASLENQYQPAAVKSLLALADKFLQAKKTSANDCVMGSELKDFNWGSNSNALNQSMLLLEAYFNTKNVAYKDAAYSNLNYVLGQNPLEDCYVTGFGTKSPLNVHHRVSFSDQVEKPIPGWIAGGPNVEQQDKKENITYLSTLHALSYTDELDSYASNEIAINWNAPLVYVLSFILSDK